MGRTVEKGLRSLGIDYADVLILGWFNRFPRPGVMEAALKLKERGLVRFLAMSGHNRPLFGETARRTNDIEARCHRRPIPKEYWTFATQTWCW